MLVGATLVLGELGPAVVEVRDSGTWARTTKEFQTEEEAIRYWETELKISEAMECGDYRVFLAHAPDAVVLTLGSDAGFMMIAFLEGEEEATLPITEHAVPLSELAVNILPMISGKSRETKERARNMMAYQ